MARANLEPAVTETSAEERKDTSAPPAPRGSSPTPPQSPRFRPGRAWILFVLALLAFNFYLGSRATQPPSRLRVPYSPFFLEQVTAGSRQGDHVEGDGDPGYVQPERAVRGVEADDTLPDGDSRVRRQRRPVAAAPAKGRGRQRPAARYGSAVVAEPVARLRADDPLRRSAVLADAPCRKRSERSRLVRALARTSVPTVRRPRHVRGRSWHRRGEGGADGGRRLPPPSREVPTARGSDTARGTALGPAGHGQDAARAGGRGRGGRARSSRWRRPSSSKRSSASAHHGCAICSRRRRRPRPRSCSSTSSTRSAAHARPVLPASAAATTSASRR